MSDYFDDHEVKARVVQRYRLLTRYRIHAIVTVIAAPILLLLYDSIFLADVAGPNNIFIQTAVAAIVLFVVPLLLHYLWLRYREQMEAAVDREMKTAFEYRKRKHENATYLTDDGELWQEEAFQQEKRKRLME
jgi:K+-sensing histidine kinase KdpD